LGQYPVHLVHPVKYFFPVIRKYAQIAANKRNYPQFLVASRMVGRIGPRRKFQRSDLLGFGLIHSDSGVGRAGTSPEGPRRYCKLHVLDSITARLLYDPQMLAFDPRPSAFDPFFGWIRSDLV
jgi:hypothetical protein